ncbi:hypothetical protein [Methylobacterium planeticum]|uniref:Uncharacterized protein n=1 Tax=Methylobacterium planeticum TaxID=2615211 RepID=A0A6N6MXP6_9HYPH|nr:hypothetical protein [Methylobacterium planeticum]KAB1075689.1 hypothetical protein F6X51_03190 [Methylobacterium planeticum]
MAALVPSARAQGDAAPTCFLTGGGALEICRGGGEAEGVFFTPRPCEFAGNVQLLRLTGAKGAPGPLQAVYQGETPTEARRRGESCEARRATTPLDGGSVRSGRLPEQLATTMPPTRHRLWEMARALTRPESRAETRAERRRGKRGGGRGETAAPPAPAVEGIAARNPMVITGRDWAGDEYYYVFLLATAPTEGGNRHVLIQARTYDFERFDIRSREDADKAGADKAGGGREPPGRAGTPAAEALVWAPFMPETEDRPRRRARGGDNPSPSAVLDAAGQPVIANCTGQGFDTHGLVGSISVVDQVYHYFYTDVLPADCNEPVLKRRLGLYLRTSRDLAGDRVWSAPRLVAEPLPVQSLVRVAKAKGMDRWAVSYSCSRPANAPGGPVADLCVQYTPDLSVGALAGLTWYAEPVTAMRSPAYLGLRSGGDGSGRFGRAQHFWMTDRYGNLDTPASFPAKAGFLTWLDRLAPGQDGTGASTVFGRPVYWGTWSVRQVGAK